eukprot:TRINITY_DN51277_c0_g1_i1.p1 TRINITY_DN51277_c0_g1~~TRINITY_DN51277_c0_g1_i1.p1  ORF type:complete len:210 (+),score=23.44 TRINITY_DN51277_c0_g1_i1:127-756(+)
METFVYEYTIDIGQRFPRQEGFSANADNCGIVSRLQIEIVIDELNAHMNSGFRVPRAVSIVILCIVLIALCVITFCTSSPSFYPWAIVIATFYGSFTYCIYQICISQRVVDSMQTEVGMKFAQVQGIRVELQRLLRLPRRTRIHLVIFALHDGKPPRFSVAMTDHVFENDDFLFMAMPPPPVYGSLEDTPLFLGEAPLPSYQSVVQSQV